MSFALINIILDSKLESIANLPFLQKENTLMKPANTPSWCRATLLPSETSIESIGNDGRERYNGLYQIDLFYINNSGTLAAFEMADVIISNFSKGIYLTGGNDIEVMVIKSFIDPAKPFPNYYQLPVLVKWQCDM